MDTDTSFRGLRDTGIQEDMSDDEGEMEDDDQEGEEGYTELVGSLHVSIKCSSSERHFQAIDPEDHATLDALAPEPSGRTLADLIFNKMAGGAASKGIDAEEEGEAFRLLSGPTRRGLTILQTKDRLILAKG